MSIQELERLPKVYCPLVGKDGNAYSIIGRFKIAARKAKWPKEAISMVMSEAMSSDYNHLLRIIMKYSNEQDFPEDDNDDESDPWEDKD